jgi:hypothetical protein
VNGKLTCVADDKTSQDARSIRDAAYRAYEDDICNAWKKGRSEQTNSNNTHTATDAPAGTDLKSLYAARDAELENAWRANK